MLQAKLYSKKSYLYIILNCKISVLTVKICDTSCPVCHHQYYVISSTIWPAAARRENMACCCQYYVIPSTIWPAAARREHLPGMRILEIAREKSTIQGRLYTLILLLTKRIMILSRCFCCFKPVIYLFTLNM